MARGNWTPEVIKARPRCRLCARVVLVRDMVRLDGIKPAHKTCADAKQLTYTVGAEFTVAAMPPDRRKEEAR